VSVHAYHEGLPGYNPNAVLHDGCEECEGRAGISGLGYLDWRNSRRVVERAARWGREGLEDTNPTEVKLLRDVWTVLVWLQTNTEVDAIAGEMPWRDFERMERELFGRSA
jgi:hypothetical protein